MLATTRRLPGQSLATSSSSFRSTLFNHTPSSARRISNMPISTTTTVPSLSNHQRKHAHLRLQAPSSRPAITKRAYTDRVFHSPFYQFDHCSHCNPTPTTTSPSPYSLSKSFKPSHSHQLHPIAPQHKPQQSTDRRPLSLSHSQPNLRNTPPTPTNVSSATMSSTASNAAPAKPASQPGQGILVPASKVHTSIKSELLSTLDSAEFNPTQGGRVPKLVGILATDKEDAESYAEVSLLIVTLTSRSKC